MDALDRLRAEGARVPSVRAADPVVPPLSLASPVQRSPTPRSSSSSSDMTCLTPLAAGGQEVYHPSSASWSSSQSHRSNSMNSRRSSLSTPSQSPTSGTASPDSAMTSSSSPSSLSRQLPPDWLPKDTHSSLTWDMYSPRSGMSDFKSVFRPIGTSSPRFPLELTPPPPSSPCNRIHGKRSRFAARRGYFEDHNRSPIVQRQHGEYVPGDKTPRPSVVDFASVQQAPMSFAETMASSAPPHPMRATLETAIVRAKAEVSLLSAIMEDDLLQVKRIVEKLPELLHTKLKSFEGHTPLEVARLLNRNDLIEYFRIACYQ